jgi:SH3-like domain-containing protein
MGLGDQLRGWLASRRDGARRRPRAQAEPVGPPAYDQRQLRPAHWLGLGLAAAAAVAITAGLVFTVLSLTRSGEPRPAPTPIGAAASPSPVAVADLFATQTPTAFASPTPTPRGERVQVGNTQGQGANLRREPSPTGERVRVVPDGAIVEVIGPDREVEGRRWRNVRDADGEVGWILSSLLFAEGSVPPVGAAATERPVSAQPAAPAPVPTAAAPRPTATRVAAPAATARPASRAQVANTSGQGANVRTEPGTGGRVLKTLAEGTPVDVLGPEREVDGRIWRQVRDSAGVSGWIVGGALVTPGTVPTPAPPGARTTVAPATSTPAASGPTATAAPTTPQPISTQPAGAPGGLTPIPTPTR